MNNSQLLETISKDLITIKWFLFGTLLSGVLFVLLLTYWIISFSKKVKSLEQCNIDDESGFEKKAENLLEKNEIDSLIKLAEEKVSGAPNHSYALWYLGKAYFIKEDFIKSKEVLLKLKKINPAWDNQYIEPFLKQLEGKC